LGETADSGDTRPAERPEKGRIMTIILPPLCPEIGSATTETGSATSERTLAVPEKCTGR
jgi:hypothetical protein